MRGDLAYAWRLLRHGRSRAAVAIELAIVGVATVGAWFGAAMIAALVTLP
ncbi:hypothetical protein [Novosphingobium colocasiae]